MNPHFGPSLRPRDHIGPIRQLHLQAVREMLHQLQQGRSPGEVFETIPVWTALRLAAMRMPDRLLHDLRFHAPLKASLASLLLLAFERWENAGRPWYLTDTPEARMDWLGAHLIDECVEHLLRVTPEDCSRAA